MNPALSRTVAAVPSVGGGGGGGGEMAARSSSRTVTAKQVYLNKSRYVAGQNTRNAQYGEERVRSGLLRAGSWGEGKAPCGRCSRSCRVWFILGDWVRVLGQVWDSFVHKEPRQS